MIKQILGKLPRKPTSKSSQGDPNSDGEISNINSSNTNATGVTRSSTSKATPSSNKVSNTDSNGVIKPNQAKKSGSLVSQTGPTLNAASYEALPSFRDVPASEKTNLFIRKLKMCCIVFDFTDPSKNLREKDIKRQTLLELVDYLSTVNSKFSDAAMQEITKMVATNLFRTFPSSYEENKFPGVYDAEEEEPTMEPSWSHLQIVYEFLLRFVASPETEAKLAKRYIDHSFILRLLDLFDSEDQREREYLKTILHRIYGKFMVHRPFIRKAINNVFYRFIFETEKHNGIAELLEILGSIINGFALPLKEEHKLFLIRALIPLHKPKCVAMYHQQLSYCITQFVEKDSKLADTVISGLLKYWPVTNSTKEVMFLGELEEVLEATQAAEFQRFMVPLFRQIRRCISSSHFQVGERALFLWNNDHIRNLIIQNRETTLPIIFPSLEKNTGDHWNQAVQSLTLNVGERALFLWNNDHIRNLIIQNRETILPIIFPSLEKNTRDHWNQAVQSLTLNVRKIFSDADQTLFDECLSEFHEDEMKERENRDKREQTWKLLEDVVFSKAVSNDEAVLVSNFVSSVAINSSSKPKINMGT